MKRGVDDGVVVPFEAKDCMGVGVGVGVGDGVGVVKGEGLGVGVSCGETFQIHVRETVPFSFVAIAEMFHVPTAGLVFV